MAKRSRSDGLITAAELMQRLQGDPEWKAREEAEERRRLARARRLAQEEQPLVQEAARADCRSGWHLSWVEISLLGAGVYQALSRTSTVDWVFPAGIENIGPMNPLSMPFVLPPHGDDPMDQTNILLGIVFFEECVR